MSEIAILLLIFLIEYVLFYFLPVLHGSGSLFGIVLDPSVHRTGSRLLRIYRRDLTLAVLLSIAATLLTWRFTSNSLPIAYIVGSFLNLYPLIKYLRSSWRLRDRSTVKRVATPLRPRHLKDFTNPFLELSVVVTVFFPFVILAHYYQALPERIPIHSNVAGVADAWARRSFWSIFFAPMLGAFLQIFWIVLKRDIVQARFRVPAEGGEMIAQLKETSLRANTEMIDWCRFMVGLVLSLIAMLILTPVLRPDAFRYLNIFIWAAGGLMLTGLAYYLYRMILASREIKALSGQYTFPTATEMVGWTDGLFYYNPQDVALIVEKPGGVGYTINFARGRVLVYLALILAPIIFVVVSLIMLEP